jgi:hypothetical protein
VREEGKIKSQPQETPQMMRQYEEEEEEEEEGTYDKTKVQEVKVVEEVKPFKPLDKNTLYIEKSIFVISKYPFFEQFERIL